MKEKVKKWIERRLKDWRITVREVFMHRRPDVDEICAWVILVKYARDVMKGIESVMPTFTGKDPGGSDKTNDAKGRVLIGCGKDSRYCEYRANALGDRIQGHCATTLVVEHHGLENLPELKALVPRVLRLDSDTGCMITELPELAKIGYEVGISDEEVFHWLAIGLDAIIAYERDRPPRAPGEKSLMKMFEDRASQNEGKKYPHIRARGHIFNQIKESRKAPEGIMQLHNVAKCMYRVLHDRGQDTAYVEKEWIGFALDQMYNSQVNFWGEVAALKSHEKHQKAMRKDPKKAASSGYIPFEQTVHARIEQPDPKRPGKKLKPRDVRLRLFTFESDSRHAHKAIFHVCGHLGLIMRSTGHVQVFSTKDVDGLSLEEAIRMIRWREKFPLQRRDLDWEMLKARGRYPGDEKWTFVFGLLLNSSLKHEAPKTRIPLEDLSTILQHAFHRDKLRKWWAEEGVDYDASERAHRLLYLPKRVAKPARGRRKPEKSVPSKNGKPQAGFKNRQQRPAASRAASRSPSRTEQRPPYRKKGIAAMKDVISPEMEEKLKSRIKPKTQSSKPSKRRKTT